MLHFVDTEKCLQLALELGVIVFGIGTFALFPFYGVLSSYFGSYVNSYIWVVSASNMSGVTPAIAMLICFWLILWIFATRAHCFLDTTFISSLRVFRKITYNNVHHLLKRFILVWIVNATVVLAVNIGYVGAVVNGHYDVTTLNIFALLLSLFKLVWNNILLGGILYRKLIRNVLQINLTGYHMILLSLFNNVVVPYIAEALISPNCFLYALRKPPAIEVTYVNENCGFDIVCDRIGCRSYYRCSVVNGYLSGTGVVNTSYIPPFHYSYQCSSFVGKKV